MSGRDTQSSKLIPELEGAEHRCRESDESRRSPLAVSGGLEAVYVASVRVQVFHGYLLEVVDFLDDVALAFVYPGEGGHHVCGVGVHLLFGPPERHGHMPPDIIAYWKGIAYVPEFEAVTGGDC